MPELTKDQQDQIKAFEKKIQVLKEQQDQNLKDYAKKYSVLDGDFRELSKKVDVVSKQLSELERLKSNIEGDIASSKDKAPVIIREAKEKADDILQVAKDKAAEASVVAEKIVNDARSVQEKADVIDREASIKMEMAGELLRSAEIKEAQAAKHLAEAESRNRESEETIQSIKDQEEEINKRIEELSATKERLDSRLADVSKRERLLQESEITISDLKSKLKVEIAEAESLKDYYIQAKNSVDIEFSALREELKKQSERQVWRDKELDAGFTKLKHDQETLKRELRNVEAVKKELLSKETT